MWAYNIRPHRNTVVTGLEKWVTMTLFIVVCLLHTHTCVCCVCVFQLMIFAFRSSTRQTFDRLRTFLMFVNCDHAWEKIVIGPFMRRRVELKLR